MGINNKKVAIIQSNYIPWKGYFDIINDVDLFIFYDDLQYTKNDWRNRNRIKTINGLVWLTIPVGKNEKRLICEVELSDNSWGKKHWVSIKQAYSKTPYFAQYRDFFEHVYLAKKWTNLAELNQYLIKVISEDFLRIKTIFADSRDYQPTGKKFDRLHDLLKKANGSIYITGPSARDYLDEQKLTETGIDYIYKDYGNYPEYPQVYPPFEHKVSIIDLLFNCGPESSSYIWGWREE
jgi:hypothetical protein